MARATCPRSAPGETLQVMSIFREAFSRVMMLGAGTIVTSATSPSGTWAPVGVAIGRLRSAVGSSRTFSTPQTKTSKIFCWS